ncbi:NAD(P)-dependent dehydrogenase (short-subunit alcohol dehydrogenase family) [Psychromicrobium silvestre]|uniref:NAD(P)-dependent dehydrogenase (Short-subunit alcohol dehydrogenase family) n=1 Tax=Psychromicrobium silvestre TaxID=1645614 RepID=A0A7Y9LUR6_9MICC|nr:SDR family NAD(P)-dependent oxidoreductase [Psychromicrobium silvestre]NYE95910.1 NAD(P)-dependent dehydrogenase (short-subunit alcohol dehydrogenase family) [Psychromicrobium silvestre]
MSTQPVIILTGATNGIGRLAAFDLARSGARLGILARSEQKAEAVREEIEQRVPGAAADIFLADLSLLSDVRRVGQEIAAYYPQINVLINNAGLHAFSQRVTSEGLAEMTAVNYLAPWVLTNALRDKLLASAPARIVTVASRASLQVRHFDPMIDLTETANFTRRESGPLYGRSKLLDVMFTQELGRQLAGTGVAVTCCCPGFNATGLGRELPFSGFLEKALSRLNIGNPQHGADTIVKLAVDPNFADITGGYFAAKTMKPLECPQLGRGEAIQRELWEVTANLIGSKI